MLMPATIIASLFDSNLSVTNDRTICFAPTLGYPALIISRTASMALLIRFTASLHYSGFVSPVLESTNSFGVPLS